MYHLVVVDYEPLVERLLLHSYVPQWDGLAALLSAAHMSSSLCGDAQQTGEGVLPTCQSMDAVLYTGQAALHISSLKTAHFRG